MSTVLFYESLIFSYKSLKSHLRSNTAPYKLYQSHTKKNIFFLLGCNQIWSLIWYIRRVTLCIEIQEIEGKSN